MLLVFIGKLWYIGQHTSHVDIPVDILLQPVGEEAAAWWHMTGTGNLSILLGGCMACLIGLQQIQKAQPRIASLHLTGNCSQDQGLTSICWLNGRSDIFLEFSC